MIKICNFIAKWMGLLVLLVAALSLLAPTTFSWISTWYINPMLGVIMFGMGLTLSPKDFKIVLSRPKDILMGCFLQFLIMPLLAWGLTWAFSLPKELALGVILVGCCPGGTASNVITYLAKGDLALSVGVTAASTILAPLLTPLLVLTIAGGYSLHCGHSCFPQCFTTAVGRCPCNHRGDASQPAGTHLRIPCLHSTADVKTKAHSFEYRSRHAELRSRIVVGGTPLRSIPPCHRSGCHIQRLA